VPALLEGGIPLLQYALVVPQDIDIPRRYDARRLIEEKSAPLRFPGGEGKVLVAEHDRGVQLYKLFAVSDGLVVSPDILGPALPADADLFAGKIAAIPLPDAAAQREGRGSSLGSLGVNRPPERGSVGKVIQGFEEISLALPVLPDQEDPVGSQLDLGVREVAKGAGPYTLEGHVAR
jgi:hypothetical protein